MPESVQTTVNGLKLPRYYSLGMDKMTLQKSPIILPKIFTILHAMFLQ